jgi:hypothetical protein
MALEYEKIYSPPISPDGKGWVIDGAMALYQDLEGFDSPAIQYQTSAAHTFGNVLAAVERYFLNYFPEDRWNEIIVSTQIGHRQIKSIRDRYKKRKRPILVMKPRVNWDRDGKFLSGTLLTERFNEAIPYDGWGTMFNFIVDPKNHFYVKYFMNRHVVDIDFIVSFDTMIEQINFMNALQNTHFQHPFDIETPLENHIPNHMIELISKACDLPVHDNEDSVYTFLQYLNSISIDPVTYKLKSASANEEFFRYYDARIECVMSGLSADEGEQDGLIRKNFNINFTFRCEFTGTGFFHIQHQRIQELSKDILERYKNPNDYAVIPIMTDYWHREDFNLSPGWEVIAAPSYYRSTEADDHVVEFDTILSPNFFQVYAHHLMNGIPIDLFLNIKIRRMGELMIEGNDYILDYEKMTITLLDTGLVKNVTYKILFIANLGYINQTLTDLIESNFTYDREKFNAKISRN